MEETTHKRAKVLTGYLAAYRWAKAEAGILNGAVWIERLEDREGLARFRVNYWTHPVGEKILAD